MSKTWYESGRNETALCAAISGFVCELFLLLHVLVARAQVATRSVLQSMCISVGGWDPLSIDLWLVHVVLAGS